MAAVSELSVLLFALISSIHSEELILVLWNTSDLWPKNSSVTEDLKQRLVSVANTSTYMIQNLTRSDSGLYQEECWTEGKVTHERNITMTVCGSIGEISRVDGIPEGTLDLHCPGAADHLDGQWLKQDHPSEQGTWTRVFGDNTASVMDNDRGRYQVVENTSALRISNFPTTVFRLVTCLLMNQQQCVSSQPVQFLLNIEWMYRSVGETAVLQCPVTDLSEDKPPYWETKSFNGDQVELNFTGSLVDQNYSLVLTSVALNHSGGYLCQTSIPVKTYMLVVCLKSPPPPPPAVELSSEGDDLI
ncbi:hypothetical protein JOQ06_015390 [Pogonophryne albipinna]|uniref:Ig-like domain-containing protein n=1 Tax=Pogonophryne albipinna TaxID=1090488 RepID=A0AAD6F711_9TELE|nr:hypothetical protein JOQ06_015390 [Pogonophryne albipinna]